MKKKGTSNKSTNEEKATNRKTNGIFVRLSETEKERLKKLSRQAGVSVSHLLRTGALEGLDRLPRFRKLPAEVLAELAKMEKLTTAMWYISQRVDQDQLYAKDIRVMVYEVGEITKQINQFCQVNLSQSHTVSKLDELVECFDQPGFSSVALPEIIGQLRALRDSFQND